MLICPRLQCTEMRSSSVPVSSKRTAKKSPTLTTKILSFSHKFLRIKRKEPFCSLEQDQKYRFFGNLLSPDYKKPALAGNETSSCLEISVCFPSIISNEAGEILDIPNSNALEATRRPENEEN